MLGKPMSLSTWMVLILVRLMGKEIYFWTHGWYGKEGKGKTFLKKDFFGLANGTMTYGKYASDLMIIEGLKAEKITRIGNFLMYDEQIKMHESLAQSAIYKEHFGNNNPVIIFVGRLTPIKKLHQILDAQATCKERGFDFNVAYVGDGTEKESLELRVENLGLRDRVWFYVFLFAISLVLERKKMALLLLPLCVLVFTQLDAMYFLVWMMGAFAYLCRPA